MGTVVGRDRELEAIASFLDVGPSGARVLLLEGEAGIGKTRLWQEGVAAARGRQYEILAARPGATEAQLAFAALGDLLAEVARPVLDELPEPRRRALQIALLVEDSEGPPLDPRLIGVAFLGAVQALAALRPVVIAIDDVQWLDPASAGVVTFAARRVRSDPVVFLLTVRTGEGDERPYALEQALDDRLCRVPLGPLSIGALQRLLRDRVGTVFPRPTMRRLWELSGGNPFYGLELGRAVLERGERLPLDDSVPLTLDLGELLRKRLAGLPAETRDALLAAALASESSVDLVRAVTGRDAWEHLQPAMAAQVLEIDGSRLRFSHPLLAAAAAAGADPARRRELHRRLATVAGDLEERARHLALAVERGSDENAAAALEEAARRADERGAPEAAAELLDHAVRITPPEAEEDATRRALAAAYAHSKAGDAARAQTILNELIERVPGGRRRAEVLLALLRIDTNTAMNPRVAEQALREAGDDAALRAAILAEHSQTQELVEGPPAALRSAREALRLAEEAGDETLLLLALSVVGHLETLTGGGEWLAMLERARELEARGLQVSPWYAPGHWIAVRLMWGDELDRARELLEAEYRHAGMLGDELSRAGLCFHLTQLETRAGRPAQARAHADEGWELEEAAGREQGRAVSLYARSLAEAHFGEPAQARTLAREALETFERIDDHFFTIHTRGVLAFLALGEGDYEGACAALEGMRELRRRIGVGEPGMFPFDADEIEALVGASRIDEAERLADALEARGRELDRARLLATGARCRGLVVAAHGDIDAAIATLERALAEHERLPVPLERARTLLALGTQQRRARRRKAARETLQHALAIFEQLGARVWAEKARAELARIGGRAPSSGELTPTELRIAELVAEGKRNKEVAAALVVSVHTVEAALTQIYRKLDVRSRTELARRLTRPE